MLCSVRICKHSRESKSTCSRCTGGPGRLLAPSPRSVGGAGGGGGRRLASHVLPGDLERGRGDLWQVNLAGHTHGWIWHVSMARHFGGSTWRVYLAGLFGGSSWLIHLAGFQSKEKTQVIEQEKEIESNEMYGESVDCNIIM